MRSLRTACLLANNLLRRKSLPRDDFQTWMGYINPGMMAPGNLLSFERCISQLPSNAPIVEIGSFAGLSLNNIIHLLRKAGRSNRVFSADAWRFEGAPDDHTKIPGSEIFWQDYRSNVIETFRRNVELFSGDRLPHHIMLNSDPFFASWEAGQHAIDFFGREAVLGGPIAMAYIDGDHTYEQSLRDFRNIDRCLEVGGFIVFDDSSDFSNWGSHKTAVEAVSQPNYTLVARNPNYCIKKISKQSA